MKTLIILTLIANLLLACSERKCAKVNYSEVEVEVHFMNGTTDTLTVRGFLSEDGKLRLRHTTNTHKTSSILYFPGESHYPIALDITHYKILNTRKIEYKNK